MAWQHDTDPSERPDPAEATREATSPSSPRAEPGVQSGRGAEQGVQPPASPTLPVPLASFEDQPATLQAFFSILAVSLAVDRKRALEQARAEGQQAAAQARLEARQIQREAQAAESQPKHRYLPMLAAAAGILLAVAAVAAMPRGGTELPEVLYGTWSTTAPNYANRTFQLTAKEIAFEQGTRDDFARYPIIGVTGEQDAGGTMVYSVAYSNDGTEYQFNIIHQTAENSVRLRNQPTVVWYKSTGSTP